MTVHTCPCLAESLLFCFHICAISSQSVCDLCGFHPEFWPSPLLINELTSPFLTISPLPFEFSLPDFPITTNFSVVQKLQYWSHRKLICQQISDHFDRVNVWISSVVFRKKRLPSLINLGRCMKVMWVRDSSNLVCDNQRMRVYVVVLQSQIFGQSMVGQVVGASSDLVTDIPSSGSPGHRIKGSIQNMPHDFLVSVLLRWLISISIMSSTTRGLVFEESAARSKCSSSQSTNRLRRPELSQTLAKRICALLSNCAVYDSPSFSGLSRM